MFKVEHWSTIAVARSDLPEVPSRLCQPCVDRSFAQVRPTFRFKAVELIFVLAVPRNTITASSLVGTATILLQNLPNIPSMLKEGDMIAKLNEPEICRSCSVLCTAEYCVETTQQVVALLKTKARRFYCVLRFIQLEDKMKEKISKSCVDKVSFESERNVFKA